MKKYLFLLSVIFYSSFGFSQTMKASLGAGSTSNKVKIFLTCDQTVASCLFSTLQFNLALPLSAGTATPTITVISSAFTGTSWGVTAPYREGGYINYNITTGQSPSLPVSGNIEFQAMEVQFGGGVGTYGNTVSLVCLADGGNVTNGALFYCTGSANSNGSALYYARTNTTISNGFSYNPVRPGAPNSPLGTTTSFAQFNSPSPLPIKFTDFTAVRRDNDGQLAWTVDNQDPNTLNFGIERSFNGTDFRSIGSIDANILLGAVGTYNFTDPNIVRLRSSGVIYYRLKEVDRDGHFVYSDIRSIKLDSKAITINLYPNPAQAYTNLMLDLPESTTVAVSITDVAGQTMQQFTFPGIKGNNQHKIELNKYAAGTYMIKVNAGDQMKTISVVKTE